MKHPKVSVIVPVYNTEQYLPVCAKSLLSQTLKDLEIIFVDDGSTDSSGNLCDDYAAQDSRIRVIHKTNGGVASARQAGLDAATGEYVIWADSDDWVESDMYERLYRKAKETNADIIVCGYTKDFSDGRSKRILDDFPESKRNCIESFLAKRICNSLCNKLFRMELIRQHSICFVSGINMGEDMLFFFKYLYYAVETVAIEKECFYHYRQNDSSLTKQMTPKTIEEDDKALHILKTILEGSEYSRHLQYYLINHCIIQTVTFIEQDNVALARDMRDRFSFLTILPYLWRVHVRLDYFILFICVCFRLYHFAVLLSKTKKTVKKTINQIKQ